MVENLTVARPYAKALFDYAKYNNSFEDWEHLLNFLCNLINDKDFFIFIKDKTLSHYDKSTVLNSILYSSNLFSEEFIKKYFNFILLLSEYDRLNCIKEIFYLYKNMVNVELNRLNVFIETADIITSIQKESIINNLSKRYNKNVLASFEINEKLLGGFVVKMDDFVLDSSILGNLFILRSKILA